MTSVVELRSDTFTLPTDEMRRAMATAEVGDDVWEEDPTVKRLEAMSAERLGKQAGRLAASGTMGNLVCVLTHTRPGQEVILDEESHILNYEVSGAAFVGGVQMRALKTVNGFPSAAQVAAACRPVDIQLPQSGLVCLENTHNGHGGTCGSPEDITAGGRGRPLPRDPVHMDGARLFNAAVALGRDPGEFVRDVDSVTFCLSKGLAAPVGAIICGSTEVIARARRIRKMLGGGMRQAGVIAAAGIVALDSMVDRLAEDHENAHLLARNVAKLPGVSLDLERVQTNIVIFSVDRAGGAPAVVAECARHEVRILAIDERSIRCVTHKDVTTDHIRRAVDILSDVLRDVRAAAGARAWPRVPSLRLPVPGPASVHRMSPLC